MTQTKAFEFVTLLARELSQGWPASLAPSLRWSAEPIDAHRLLKEATADF